MQNNFLFEMLPLVVFFTIYAISKNLYLATGCCIIASWLQLILCKLKYKKISKNTWLSTILITVLGGLTIVLHNKTFVMLKPSVLFWIIGISMIVGQFMGKNSIKLMLSKEMELPEYIWNKLNLSWAIFFLVMGVINLIVALNCSEYTWVKFKVFGSLCLTIVFTLITILIIFIVQKKHAKTHS